MSSSTCITTVRRVGPLDATAAGEPVRVDPLPGVRPPAAAGLAAVLREAASIDPGLHRRRLALLADEYAWAAARRCLTLAGDGAGRLTARDSVELEASDLWRAAVETLDLDWAGPVTIFVDTPSARVLGCHDATIALTPGNDLGPAGRPAHCFDATARLCAPTARWAA